VEIKKIESLLPLEGPEVKIVSDHLKNDLLGKQLKEFYIYPNSKYVNGIPGQSLLKLNDIILDVFSRGKNFYIKFNNNCYLCCEPRTGGSFNKFENKPAFRISVNNADVIFNDLIKCSYCYFLTKDKLESEMYRLCYDPITDDYEDKIDRIFIYTRKNKPMSWFLFSLSSINGVGVYLKSEILYKAKISPHTYARDLTKKHIKDLCIIAKEVSTESYNSGGAILYKYSEQIKTSADFNDKCSVFFKKRDPLNNKVLYSVIPEDRSSIFWVKEVQELL
jgi:endonuclease-8